MIRLLLLAFSAVLTFTCLADLGAAELRRDIEYGRAGDVSLKLDASIPDGDGPHPVAILIHGGGWGAGDKAGAESPRNGADITPWFSTLTDANYTWFSINYRLAPAHRWPACFEDVQTAIKWVKAHAAEFKGDPNRIVLFGHSAGGHLAFLAAVKADENTAVQAAVGYAPVTDFEQELPVRGGLSPALQNLHGRGKEMTPETLALLRETAPITHVTAKAPPFLILHGDSDQTVPLQQSLNFQARVRSMQGVCDMIILPHAVHRLEKWDENLPTYRAQLIAWLAQKLSATPSATPASTAVSAPATADSGAVAKPAELSDLSLWYTRPAAFWTEALPVGNGRLGAMVFGGLVEERLQFNEDTLWTGAPHVYSVPGAHAVLPRLRELLAQGKQKEAEALAMKEFMSRPLRQKAYQPFGYMLLRFPGHDRATNYVRSLDMDAGLAAVRYELGGVNYTRETFSSHPDQVLVHRVTADKPGQINFTLNLASPHAASQVRLEADGGALLTGKVSDQGLRFAAHVKIRAEGGTVTAARGSLIVTGADSAVILLTANTSFRTFRDITADPEALALASSRAVAQKTYRELLSRHQADHRALFRRVTIDLGRTPAAQAPTDVRLAAADKSGDPHLATLAFQLGRYLLIASSRPGDQPANLQGIWNDRLNPPWGSKYTVNINTEMNYWPAEVANLSECTEPLFRMLDDLVISGGETAQHLYAADGWVLHHNTDLWRGTAPINNSNHGIWPTGGAWLCQHLWEHYRYNEDRDFLAQRAYPIMKGAAQFFVDYLVTDPATGYLISGPSNSPEQGGLVMGPTMDHQIIRGLFSWTSSAADILGVDAEFSAKLKSMAARIAPNRIGRHGQLQEWMQDIDDPKNKHRHVSHLWGVFPGEEITSATPDLFKAARQSLIFRGDEGTGWSLGWKIAFWARFLDGDHAHKMILQQLRFVPATITGGSEHGGTYPNFFDAHPPFQIDGNFAATAGICEMLMQSHQGELALLPALPGAWPEGSVKGLRARGGIEVDFSWKDAKVQRLRLRATEAKKVSVRLGGQTLQVLAKPDAWTEISF